MEFVSPRGAPHGSAALLTVWFTGKTSKNLNKFKGFTPSQAKMSMGLYLLILTANSPLGRRNPGWDGASDGLKHANHQCFMRVGTVGRLPEPGCVSGSTEPLLGRNRSAEFIPRQGAAE